MTIDKEKLAGAVSAQVAINAALPDARSRDMIEAFRQELAATLAERNRHVAETEVIGRQIGQALAERLDRCDADATAEEQRADAERRRHEAAMRRIADARREATEKHGKAAEQIAVARAAQLAEIDRQIAMLDAAIAAGAKDISPA